MMDSKKYINEFDKNALKLYLNAKYGMVEPHTKIYIDTDSAEVIISKDTALCMYDYAKEILDD